MSRGRLVDLPLVRLRLCLRKDIRRTRSRAGPPSCRMIAAHCCEASRSEATIVHANRSCIQYLKGYVASLSGFHAGGSRPKRRPPPLPGCMCATIINKKHAGIILVISMFLIDRSLGRCPDGSSSEEEGVRSGSELANRTTSIVLILLGMNSSAGFAVAE